jgi:hypothetical protein
VLWVLYRRSIFLTLVPLDLKNTPDNTPIKFFHKIKPVSGGPQYKCRMSRRHRQLGTDTSVPCWDFRHTLSGVIVAICGPAGSGRHRRVGFFPILAKILNVTPLSTTFLYRERDPGEFASGWNPTKWNAEKGRRRPHSRGSNLNPGCVMTSENLLFLTLPSLCTPMYHRGLDS